MFTLSAILEDRENLFQDIGSPFSISFNCFSATGFIKKITDLPGRVRLGHYARGPFKARPSRRLTPPQRPPPNPSAPHSLAAPPLRLGSRLAAPPRRPAARPDPARGIAAATDFREKTV